MNKYELVYIVDAHSPQSAKDEIIKQMNDALAKCNIKLINSQVWIERHKMSFPINKIMEGTYYLLNLEGAAAAINKLHGLLRINEQILRYQTIRLEETSAQV